MRLMSDHSSQPWETLTSTRVPRSQVDKASRQLVSKLKASDKVRESVKGKSARQLLATRLRTRVLISGLSA